MATVFKCPKTYKCSDVGLILPVINESEWGIGIRAVLYFFGMMYCFVGIATVADIFMSAIETITSATKKIKVATSSKALKTKDGSVDPEGEIEFKEVEIKVWNDTVANLTLMALGSSAPEILLAIIETIGNGFTAGELGPATIVGSAAFNLHVITGVCISALPKDEKKTIKEGAVFVCTAVVSLLAYFWLYLILGPISPDVVDIWEALLTLLFFPLLVILAYMVDKNFCCGGKKSSRIGITDDDDDPHMSHTDGLYLSMPPSHDLGNPNSVDKSKVAQVMKGVDGKNLSAEEAAALVAQKVHEERPHSRAYHRASRSMRSTHSLASKMSQASISLDQHGPDDVKKPDGSHALDPSKCVVEFCTTSVSIYEGEKRARLGVRRSGCLSGRVTVKYETCNGTAEAGTDYIPRRDTVVFESKEDLKYIDIDILDDTLEEDDETFFVKLSLDKQSANKKQESSTNNIVEHASPRPIVEIGKNSVCTIVIMNDDEPGQFEFEKPSFLFKESVGVAKVTVMRHSGTDGACSVSWRAIFVGSGDSSKPGADDWGGPDQGKVNFQHGEACGNIELTIKDKSKDRAGKEEEEEGSEGSSESENRSIQLVLTEATNGAKIGKRKSTIVTVVCDDEYSSVLERITRLANLNLQKLNFTLRSWGEQIHEAMNVNGGDFDSAGWSDYLFHAFTFFWKVLFAFLVPPPKYLGGWLTFVISLTMIGLLTAIVGDLAAIFGCLLGLRDLVTAITFVALGTSLPDLFASKQATLTDKYADNAVGNVTGSNSVNVFLGLGLPWTMASIYWAAKGESFVVPAGSLSYSVVLYTATAVIALLIIALRRFLPVFGKAELGGPSVPKYICSAVLCLLWFIYIIMSALESYNKVQGF